jgi:hypothetical protein
MCQFNRLHPAGGGFLAGHPPGAKTSFWYVSESADQVLPVAPNVAAGLPALRHNHSHVHISQPPSPGAQFPTPNDSIGWQSTGQLLAFARRDALYGVMWQAVANHLLPLGVREKTAGVPHERLPLWPARGRARVG